MTPLKNITLASLLTLGSVLSAAAPAVAQSQTFLLSWSGASLGNTAAATGTITIDESRLNNPGFNSNILPSNQFVTALDLIVSGSGAGDGRFSLSNFSNVILDTHGGTLNLNTSLIGQPTSGAGFGTTHDGSSGDFNLFSTGTGLNTPTGTNFFQLTTGGSSDNMYLTQFTPAPTSPPPPPPPDVITFDNLPNEPGPNAFSTLNQANGGSTIDGVTFSPNAYVFGSQFSFGDPKTPYVTPASGQYAFTPGNAYMTTLTTTKTLYGLDLGTVNFASGGGGADQVKISAFDASGQVLGSVTTSLTGPKMSFLNTSQFASLSGIAGYNLYGIGGYLDYAADDFTFSPAAVPEASTSISLGLMLLGLGGVTAAARKRKSVRAA